MLPRAYRYLCSLPDCSEVALIEYFLTTPLSILGLTLAALCKGLCLPRAMLRRVFLHRGDRCAAATLPGPGGWV